MTNPPLTEAVYYILLSLTEPLHGYGIMQKAEQLSSGRVRLAAGTLYGALNTLLEKGWIAAGPQEGRQKRYQLTPQGREALLGELDRLRELVANGETLLGGKNDENRA
ncbi:MAG: helix-turn-helix transcriptional regulator [Candidatus Faecivivens sp.]|nr:helix-turn-helix transcriptional regulator [Candidatus Faecivivens sp.]